MPEKIQKLRTLVDELEQELQGVESLDDESRPMLKEAADEIHAALQKEDVEHQRMSVRLNDVVAEFKTSHPMLYAVVNRMVNVLGQMGI